MDDGCNGREDSSSSGVGAAAATPSPHGVGGAGQAPHGVYFICRQHRFAGAARQPRRDQDSESAGKLTNGLGGLAPT